MDTFKVIQIRQNVFDSNDREAQKLRSELKARDVFLLNLMSSPGSGKTTFLVRSISELNKRQRIGVIEADIDSAVDAQTIEKSGAKVVQLHSGGMCHLTADMTRQGLEALGTDGLDLVFLENIGNLICTADFDTGATKNAMILSVPEGDDKPLKYPHMFSMVDVVLVSKIDVMPYFDFSLSRLEENVHRLNPSVEIIPLSAKTGEGMQVWTQWLDRQISEYRS